MKLLNSVTRRSFLKGMAAMGVAGAVTGCSKSDSAEYFGTGGGGNLEGSIAPEDLSDFSKFDLAYATCPHNCGTSSRCVSRMWIKDGRIVRVTSDDSEYDHFGNYKDKEAWNDARQLACAKGRANKGRVYNTARLKYPLKQTKERGNMSGFVRITWQQAYNEVIRKYRAIYAKYGPSAIYANDANSSSGTFAAPSGATAPVKAIGGAGGTFSTLSFHQYYYSYNMVGIPNSYAGQGQRLVEAGPQGLAGGGIKHLVSFGSNVMSTNNGLSYPYLRSIQKARELNPNFKHWVIGPHFCDSGPVTATDWVQLRNYTDAALLAAVMYEMLVNTFNTDGSVKPNPWLDLNYIDTVLYGFFDSPKYYIDVVGQVGSHTNAWSGAVNPDAGKISTTLFTTAYTGYHRVSKPVWIKRSDGAVFWTSNNLGTHIPLTGYWTDGVGEGGSGDNFIYTDNYSLVAEINAVPSGQSYAAWLMGSDDRLTKANYNQTNNYTAKAYGNMPRAGLCSLPVKGVPAKDANISTTEYYTKKDYMTPKSAEWAEKICGTPASVIRELAQFLADDNNKPYLTEWAGGFQKQENGAVAFWAIQTLFAITKNWGYSHGSMGGMVMGTHGTTDQPYMGKIPGGLDLLLSSPPSATSVSLGSTGSSNPTVPSISCKEHFNGLYMAFKEELDSKGFIGGANPYWDGESRVLNDDAGAKTLVVYKRNTAGSAHVTFTDTDGRDYYDYVKEASGKPVFAGKRMYIGSSGASLNQVANPNWTAEIFRLLSLAQDNPDDPDTFCLAYFDAYMSPQARFADYVFPMAQTFEVVDNTKVGGVPFNRLPLSTPPGEAKDNWEAAFIAWLEQEKVGPFTKTREDGAPAYNKTIPTNAAYNYIGSTKPNYVSIANKQRQAIQARINSGSSRFTGMTVEKAIEAQIVPKTPELEVDVNITPADVTKTPERLALEAYLSSGDVATKPFITFAPNKFYAPFVVNHMATFTTSTAENMPASHGRMTAYAEYAVYTWEHAYDIYHGWTNERGQRNKDYENDPMLYPIPIYYAFEDAFNEMYGVFNSVKSDPQKNALYGPNPQHNWKMVGAKPATNDISKITDKLTVTVGTSHDRYNTHSSQIENPYLRELNHRVIGGGFGSGNDWNEFCVVPETQTLNSSAPFNPMISSAVQQKDMATASWREFWINDEDATQFGIKDGDLIRVSNPVGAIRAIARVSKRLVRGHGQVFQGGWYDPNPVDGVDDGACANTLMSNRASKFDNGNSVQFAYCVVEKETSF